MKRDLVALRSCPKISVIIPVYNVEGYLRECLESIANQTLSEIEIICINDCSPDSSQAILDEYASRDNRFVLLKHEQNKGLSAARNSGIFASKGDFIYFIDSDDFLACNDALENLYCVAVDDDADETIGGILKWREDTGENYLDWHENYLKKEIHGQNLKKLPELYANVIAVNKLFRRSFLEEYGIFFNVDIRKHEDNPFSCKAHILAQRISIILKTTYIYRQIKSGSIMSNVKKSDSQFRCLYCYDIFNFIESDESHHIFRSMYYPMYTRQLIGSAEILSRFSPTEDERIGLLNQWKNIINLFPENFPAIPLPQRMIFDHIKKGEMRKAWEKALEFANPGVKSPARKRHTLQKPEPPHVELGKHKKLNALLSSQVEDVYNSYSWCITAPLRWVYKKITH